MTAGLDLCSEGMGLNGWMNGHRDVYMYAGRCSLVDTRMKGCMDRKVDSQIHKRVCTHTGMRAHNYKINMYTSHEPSFHLAYRCILGEGYELYNVTHCLASLRLQTAVSEHNRHTNHSNDRWDVSSASE